MAIHKTFLIIFLLLLVSSPSIVSACSVTYSPAFNIYRDDDWCFFRKDSYPLNLTEVTFDEIIDEQSGVFRDDCLIMRATLTDMEKELIALHYNLQVELKTQTIFIYQNQTIYESFLLNTTDDNNWGSACGQINNLTREGNWTIYRKGYCEPGCPLGTTTDLLIVSLAPYFFVVVVIFIIYLIFRKIKTRKSY